MEEITHLVILGEVEDVLTQQLGLLGVGDAEFGRQVQDLQLHDVLLQCMTILVPEIVGNL